ncbi:peptidoglycan DD-metalloendopeptidase family protein [Undibacterium sp.]|uniref:peptidoglycan DD-metalloendopeptidase family protein n=1 Tax=Undibacterium sp. TaxID=1914977 RepID=UPI002C20E557|nr:peptidoglycan DD-metalloendopeptidase family protein [Undibacterium sp.]HTD02362.1 peptidoglycan DD-metalloendopeptidase family protein [Undibacterium sp.]
MKKIQFIGLGLVAALLAGCQTVSKAPVIERSADNAPAEASKPTDAAKSAKPADTRGTYVVKKGDTLYRIALDHGQSYSDIVTWNNLKNPNDIKVDQVLRVTPPEGAPQTGSVTVGSGVEVRPLTTAPAANNKTGPRGDKKPYSDAILAELQKADGPAAPSAGATASIPKPDPVIAPPVVKQPEAPASDADVVDWMWPSDGKVIATFDESKNKGLDISGKLGQAVLAAGAGKVMYAGSGIRGYGNLVIIKHSSNLLSAYAHNKSILVKEGDAITKGQKIAEMGSSDSDSVKLHFEIRQQGKPVDPSKFLPGR